MTWSHDPNDEGHRIDHQELSVWSACSPWEKSGVLTQLCMCVREWIIVKNEKQQAVNLCTLHVGMQKNQVAALPWQIWFQVFSIHTRFRPYRTQPVFELYVSHFNITAVNTIIGFLPRSEIKNIIHTQTNSPTYF